MGSDQGYCFETEILTKTGWKKFPLLNTKDDLFLRDYNGSVSLEKPTSVLSTYCESLLSYSDDSFKIQCAKDQNIIIFNKETSYPESISVNDIGNIGYDFFISHTFGISKPEINKLLVGSREILESGIPEFLKLYQMLYLFSFVSRSDFSVNVFDFFESDEQRTSEITTLLDKFDFFYKKDKSVLRIYDRDLCSFFIDTLYSSGHFDSESQILNFQICLLPFRFIKPFYDSIWDHKKLQTVRYNVFSSLQLFSSFLGKYHVRDTLSSAIGLFSVIEKSPITVFEYSKEVDDFSKKLEMRNFPYCNMMYNVDVNGKFIYIKQGDSCYWSAAKE